MLLIAGSSTQKVMALLTGGGLAGAIESFGAQQGLNLPRIAAQQIIPQNVSSDVADLSTMTTYPLVYVYCTKVVNELREKFRTFSGESEMMIEVRVSQDRLDHIEVNLQAYVDSVTQVLDSNRGDWGDGFFFDGEYNVSFGGVKHGGRNFLQAAKIAFVLEISVE